MGDDYEPGVVGEGGEHVVGVDEGKEGAPDDDVGDAGGGHQEDHRVYLLDACVLVYGRDVNQLGLDIGIDEERVHDLEGDEGAEEIVDIDARAPAEVGLVGGAKRRLDVARENHYL